MRFVEYTEDCPFLLTLCFAGNVHSRSTAKEPITMRWNLFVSLLILVGIVAEVSCHILLTNAQVFFLGDNCCFGNWLIRISNKFLLGTSKSKFPYLLNLFCIFTRVNDS